MMARYAKPFFVLVFSIFNFPSLQSYSSRSKVHGLDQRTALISSITSASSLVSTQANAATSKSAKKRAATNSVCREWIVEGTNLPHLSLFEALKSYCIESFPIMPMAQWPDPILRVSANAVEKDLFGTPQLQVLAQALCNTCRDAGAVGLAAQQCGVDASLIFLEDQTKTGIILINPRFVHRSPEIEMRVWTEECLVLPPWFRATVLRDAAVIVEAENLEGQTQHYLFKGELARAVQHECQHDQGILIIDHVADLEDDPFVTLQMLKLEMPLHYDRQELAFARPVVYPII